MSQLPIPQSLPTSLLPKLAVSRAAIDSIVAVAIKLVGAGLALVVQVLLARTLGHTGYGAYAYVFAWLQLVLLFSQAGFSTAALKYIAEYRALGHEALVAGFQRRSVQLTIIQSCCGGFLFVCAAAACLDSDSFETWQAVLIAGVSIPVVALFFLGNAIVRAAGQVIPSMLASLAPALLFLGFLLLALIVAERQISVSSAQLMYLGSFAGGLIVIALLWHQKEGARALPRREYRTSEWFGTATLMTLGSSLMYLQGRTGVLVSGWFLNDQEVGTYAAVERLADAALLGVVAMNMLTAPQFSSLHARGKQHELRRHARMAASVSTMFMLAVVVPMVVAGKPLLRLFGDDFVAGYPVLLVLLVSVGFNAMSGSVDYLLNMTGHQRIVLKILASALVVNLTVSLMLIPRFGIIGTAVASAASSLFWNGAMLLVARRRLGVWSNVGRIGSSRFI